MKNIYKRISATIIAIAMTIMMLPMSENVFVSAEPTVWDGTTITAVTPVGDVYSVSNGAELAWIAQQVNAGYTFSWKTINLTADIVLNDTTDWENWGTTPPANFWTAIGNNTYKFAGTFDGQSHTISGICIRNDDINYQGLFGYSTGTIKNVGVINGYVRGNVNIAGIAGVNSGTISNCYNTGIITGKANVGGIFGYCEEINATVENCYNTGEIIGVTSYVVNQTVGNVNLSSIGGIAGSAYYGTIKNCYNTGAVSGSDNIGGIIGAIWNYQAKVTNCYNTGAISGFQRIGGIVGGKNSGEITNCYYYGCNAGIGGTGASQTGTTPFVKINDNPLGVGGNTTITENTATTLLGGDLLGDGFKAEFTGEYNSSDTGVATVSGTSGMSIAGISVGTSTISGRTLTITQNELASGGFTVAPKTIIVPISMPLSVTVITSKPTVTTQAVTDISNTTATGNGNITDIGSPNPTAYGVCWNTTGIPTISNNKTDEGAKSSTGTFTSSITGLSPNTTYYIRAYATNSAGTSYGFNVMFTTTALVNAVEPSFSTNLSGETTYTKNDTATALTVSATASDGGSVTYQWYKNTENNNTTGTEILGATSATYTPSTSTVETSYYYVIATNTNNSVNGTKTATTTSGIKKIVINAIVNAAAPSFSTNLSGETTYTKNATATALTVSATASDSGTVTYKWYKNTTNSTTGGTEISGATSATYTPSTSTVGTTYYFVIATNTNDSVNGTKTATTTSSIKKIVINAVAVPSAPTPAPEKTLEVIETPAEIKNPEKITVKPVGEAFTQSIEVRMKDDQTVKKAIEDALDEVIKEELTGTTVFPLDISLYIKGTDTKVQPNTGTSVVITCPIPESLLANKDSIKVVCIIDDKLTVLETKVVLIDGVYCVQFNATHFSPYAMVVDTANVLNNNTANPKAGNNTVGTFSIIAILSVATLAVVSRKHKFKVVKKG